MKLLILVVVLSHLEQLSQIAKGTHRFFAGLLLVCKILLRFNRSFGNKFPLLVGSVSTRSSVLTIAVASFWTSFAVASAITVFPLFAGVFRIDWMEITAFRSRRAIALFSARFFERSLFLSFFL